MKSKLTMKLLGIVVTIATLTSLLVGLTAAPTSAAAGTLGYSQIATPSEVNNVLVPGAQISLIAASINGGVVFAYDGTTGNLYKSTDGGVTFAAPVVFPLAATEIAISPKFSTDNTLVLATPTAVYRSADGGATYYALNIALGGGAVTSVDVGYYYSGNVLSVLVGLKGSSLASNVLLVNLNQGTATALGTMTHNVWDVKFSPNHLNDAEIICVYDDGTNLWIGSIFGNLDWNEPSYPALQTILSAGVTGVKLALPTNYRGNTGATFLMAVNGGALHGIYSVTGRHAVAGNYNATAKYVGDIYSIAVTDSLAKVYFGLATGGTVEYSTDIADATPTWTGVNNLTGMTNASVVIRGSTVFCSTGGTDGALNVSTDGTNFVQTAMIDIGAVPSISLSGLKVADNNNMFLLMSNAGETYLFTTTTGGTAWQRIQTIASATVYLAISPAFAADKTVAYGMAGNTTAEMSKDGGLTWSTFNTGANTTAFAVGTGGVMYTGGDAGNFYQIGNWSNATGLNTTAGAGMVVSIAISPKDSNKIAVGDANGQVFLSTDAGATFAEVFHADGVTSFGKAGELVNVAYGPDGTLWAVGKAGTGCWGFVASDWSEEAAPVLQGNAIAFGKEGTLYATELKNNGSGIWRNLSPASGDAEAQSLNFSNFSGLMGTSSLSALQIVSAAAANTLYAIDAAPTATSYGYQGEVLGFADTLIGATAQSTPADKAVLTSVSSATVSWTAVTGAWGYEVEINSASDFSGTGNDSADITNVNATTYSTATGEALIEGATYYWRVRVYSSTDTNRIYGGWSATHSFVTAISQPTVGTVQYPTNGLMDVDVNPTFTWPASDVAGATYEFVLAEGGNVNDASNPFLIEDFAASTVTNALPSRETLKYATQYYWEVRTVTGSSKSAWTVSEFTTEPAPVVPSTTTTVPPVTTIIVPTQPVATPTVTIINSGTTTQAAQPIPSYLLWAVIAVGAILVIAVIVLIVRTRKI